jgi:hypothetical protein
MTTFDKKSGPRKQASKVKGNNGSRKNKALNVNHASIITLSTPETRCFNILPPLKSKADICFSLQTDHSNSSLLEGL